MEEMKLIKVTAFKVVASIDERQSGIKGYYKDKRIATQDAKGAGFYGSNGTVTAVNLWTDGTDIFELNNLGKYTDEDAEYRAKAIDSIKSKLTPEELQLLGIK